MVWFLYDRSKEGRYVALAVSLALAELGFKCWSNLTIFYSEYFCFHIEDKIAHVSGLFFLCNWQNFEHVRECMTDYIRYNLLLKVIFFPTQLEKKH